MTLKKSFALGAGGRTGWGLSLDDRPCAVKTSGMISAMWWRPGGRLGRGYASTKDNQVFSVVIGDLQQSEMDAIIPAYSRIVHGCRCS